MSTRVSLTIACIAIVVLSIPMIVGMVPPNRLYGFRTRLTLSRPEIWYPANTFSGWATLAAAAVSAASFWLVPESCLAAAWVPVVIFIVPLGLALMASLAYLRRLR